MTDRPDGPAPPHIRRTALDDVPALQQFRQRQQALSGEAMWAFEGPPEEESIAHGLHLIAEVPDEGPAAWRIVAVLAIVRHPAVSADEAVYEQCNALVDAEYSGQGLYSRMSSMLVAAFGEGCAEGPPRARLFSAYKRSNAKLTTWHDKHAWRETAVCDLPRVLLAEGCGSCPHFQPAYPTRCCCVFAELPQDRWGCPSDRPGRPHRAIESDASP
eukprot:TRINITY_DN16899_c0_g1_i1.p1 TRINITY_DN16899_c0_g1~~TRINITY_DN16899_c0_g1_i1.p1  ORF type:complete len:215 (+),score=38.40 TRINITY_DN16899_c0_g1_i1:92-736(+)